MKILSIIGLTLIAALLYFLPNYPELAFGADSGALVAGTGASDDSIGTQAWTSPENITASDNAWATASAGSNASPTRSILFYNGDAYGDDQLVAFGNPITTGASDATATLGGATELWGASLTPAIVNDSTFGYAMTCVLNPGSVTTHYLAATNYGFSISDGAAIDGIEVAVEGFISTATCRVDSISITVYYTEAAAAVAATGYIRTSSVQIRSGQLQIR